MLNSSDTLRRFHDELTAHGFLVDELRTGADWVRCPTEDKPNKRNGSYKILPDYSVMFWKNWGVEGEQGYCFADSDEKLTPAEKKKRDKQREAFNKELEAEQERRYAAAAKVARAAWEHARPVDSFPYLERKKVPSLGFRTDGKVLFIPMYGADGNIQSLQRILPNKPKGGNDKFNFAGGKAEGGFFPIPAEDEKKDGVLLIGEGYATTMSAHLATEHAALVAFSAGNLEAVGRMARAKYPDRKLVFLADDDCLDRDGNPRSDDKNTGYVASRKAAASCGGVVAYPVRLKDEQGKDKKTDFNDVHLALGLDAVKDCIDKALTDKPEKKVAYHCLNIKELIEREYPPREQLLAPILALQSLSMVFAMRGVGKTFFALSCAYAVASGGAVFGRWFAPRPARVLYIDGEMPAVTLQERLRNIARSSDSYIDDPDMLRILTPDEQDAAMPNLGTLAGQQAVEPFLDGVALVVVDNLATLARTGKSNDEDSWTPIQTWLLSLRRRGISVLLVHHAGKNGSQRGTGAKEDILDTVLELKRPSDYSPEQGARFEVHFTKARGLYGEDTEPFEAMLSIDADGQCSWHTQRVVDLQEERIIELTEAGLSEREIVEELKDSGVTRYQVKSVRRQQEGKGKHFAKSRGGASTHRNR